jgi:hypothetical protein
MTEHRMQELKDHYLSKKGKDQKILMYEFWNHVKHEARMNMRQRHMGEEERQYNPT